MTVGEAVSNFIRRENISSEEWRMTCHVLDKAFMGGAITYTSNKKYDHLGWIPVDEKLPENDHYILLSFENFSIPVIGRYEEDEEGGAFYEGDDDTPLVKHDLFVNAWMPLPAPYRP